MNLLIATTKMNSVAIGQVKAKKNRHVTRLLLSVWVCVCVFLSMCTMLVCKCETVQTKSVRNVKVSGALCAWRSVTMRICVSVHHVLCVRLYLYIYICVSIFRFSFPIHSRISCMLSPRASAFLSPKYTHLCMRALTFLPSPSRSL